MIRELDRILQISASVLVNNYPLAGKYQRVTTYKKIQKIWLVAKRKGPCLTPALPFINQLIRDMFKEKPTKLR